MIATVAKRTEPNFPVKQRRHKYINTRIDQWLDIHFGDASYNGNIVIGCRNPHKQGVRTLSVRPLTELRPYVKMIHASSRRDYYITANTVTGANRLSANLFSTNNIVIDVDCHDGRDANDLTHLVESFIWLAEQDLWAAGVIPSPNSIVRTGRGVQLWWALKPNYAKNLFRYNAIKDTFMRNLEALLETYCEKFEGLSVDRVASMNPVGYFRMPLTYNTKAGCYGSLDVLHSERFDPQDLMDEFVYPKVSERLIEKRRATEVIPMLKSDRAILENFQTAGALRVSQLIRLRNRRDNEVGSEMRDHFNFSVYNALRMSLGHDGAMVRLRYFNAGFKQPMTERELANCICTAKAKDGYNYTNKKLIKFLKITPEEQAAIGLFPAGRKRRAKSNASRDAARAALREDRDYRILELHKQGVSQAETARILGIGKNTVGRVLRRLQTEALPVEVIEPIIEQSDRHQFGAIYVILNRNATRGLPLSDRAGETRQDEGVLFAMPELNSS